MIEFHAAKKEVPAARFSILIPSWNNLEFLKLCVKSIEKNSSFEHQVIVHVNEGQDGTLDWVKEKGLDFTYSKENVGVCYALNAMRNLVRTDYMVFANDDMYLCPGWDKFFQEEIERLDTNDFFLSGTVIEPKLTGNKAVIAPFDYGSHPENFEEEKLLQKYNDHPKENWSGATWPPNILPTRLWDLVGGYSTEFSPGMYSDPDFSKKLWEAGVREFKGISSSRAYHFMSKTVGRIKKNNGSKQFFKKWGMTSSTFVKFYLKRGEPYQGTLKEPALTSALRKKRFKNKLKKLTTI